MSAPSNEWLDALAKLQTLMPEGTFTFGMPISKVENLLLLMNDDGHMELSPSPDFVAAARADERAKVLAELTTVAAALSAEWRSREVTDGGQLVSAVNGYTASANLDALIAKLGGAQ